MNLYKKAGVVFLASALLLTGCASGGDDTDAAPAQTLVVAPWSFPSSLDIPKYAVDDAVLFYAEQVFDTLVTSADGSYEPKLAESWENPDPNTWVFHLREGVTFSDGSPFTAADVSATIKRHIEVESTLAPLLNTITGFDDSDPNTLVLTTEAPLGNLLGTLTLLYVAQGSSVGDDAYWRKPIGTGPFAIEKFSPDESLKLVRNDAYWGTPATLDSLEIRDIPEASARQTALETGEIDVTTGVAPDQVDSVRQMDSVVLDSVDSLSYWMGWFNNERAPFTDVRVRQALWHAVDFETVIPALFGESAAPGRAPVAASAFGAPELEPYAYDPKLAKKLLAEAGFPNGFETTISFPTDGGPSVRPLSQALISAWAEIGVTVTPVESERANWLNDLLPLNWDMQIFINTTATGDADFTLSRLYKSTAKRLGFASPEVDAWLNEASSSVDQDRRAELYGMVSEYLWDNAVGFWPAQMKINVAYRDDVEGLVLPSNGRIPFAEVSRG